MLLPIWGFFFGFGLGAQTVQVIFGDAFLATVTSWVVGFIVAAIFAVLAYLFYIVAVAIVSFSLGYSVAVGLLTALGMRLLGFIVWLIGRGGGAALAFVVLRFNIQKIVIGFASGSGRDYPRFETRASKSAPSRQRSGHAAQASVVIFQRSLLREFGSYAAAVFSVLLAIVVTSQLVRLLSRAAGGKIPSDAIIALIGFTAMNYLPILLALTLFVSVLMTVSRSYSDSEMVVWSASGVSLFAWVRPVLVFAAPIVLLIALLGAVPLAVVERARPGVPAQARQPRGGVADRPRRVPRVRERGARVLRRGRRRRGRASCATSSSRAASAAGSGVTVSREGFIETRRDGDRFAVLLNGRQLRRHPRHRRSTG